MHRTTQCGLTVTAAATIILGGCASAPTTNAVAENLPGTDACFLTHSVAKWTVVDESTLIVDSPARGSTYLVKLNAPIKGMDSHMRLAFTSTGFMNDRFCGDNGYVIAPNGMIPTTERVASVRAINAAEVATLMEATRNSQMKPQT